MNQMTQIRDNRKNKKNIRSVAHLYVYLKKRLKNRQRMESLKSEKTKWKK